MFFEGRIFQPQKILSPTECVLCYSALKQNRDLEFDMHMAHRSFRGISASAMLLATIFFATGVQAKTCSEEMVIIKAEIDKMPSDSDKNLAVHQYEKAQERLSAGKEASCLRYLNSAHAAIEADRMHDD